MLEITDGTIKNGRSKDTGNIGTQDKHNTENSKATQNPPKTRV